MTKRYLITGVSGVDPYTNVFLVPQILLTKKMPDGSKKIVQLKNFNDNEIPKEVKSDNVFIDGSMLNILRKYIKNNNPITDIYIYLTKDMAIRKEIYRNAIETLYKNVEISELNIVFYPDDFYKNDYENRLRKDDVQKFASYYKEIFEIYSEIAKKNNADEIILNISSGTPAFKADMMIMAVTNNLSIEQTANSIENLKLEEYVKEKEKNIYTDLLNKLQDVKLNYENSDIKINIESRPLKDFSIDKVNEKLKFLNETEKVLETRTTRESIDQIKKIMLLESIEDSIEKKDYCGIFYNLKSNEQYLKNNKQELLEIAGNLYYRYIGNDEKAKKSIQKDPAKLEQYYPIYKAESIKKYSKEKTKEINEIIEKSNIMRIKSKREEMNDWLLISTPLIEAISSLLIIQKTNFNFEKILVLDNNSNKLVISLTKFNQNAPQEIKDKYKKVVGKSEKYPLNATFYKNIIFEMLNNIGNLNEKEEINKILDNIVIVDLARTERVSAAHSIQNISRLEFERLYKNNLLKHKRYNRLKNITNDYINDKANQSVKCVENAIKRLMLEILPNNNEETKKYFEESINIYSTLEQRLLNLLKDEIYK